MNSNVDGASPPTQGVHPISNDEQSTNPMNIELVFDQDCPNVGQAREAISAALVRVGAPPIWTEWDRAADVTPHHLSGFGSPTVLVNGRDVSADDGGANADATPDANSCRVYRTNDGRVCGAPAVETIVAAITRSAGSST
jgi:mercuric ion transport protein